MVAVDMSAKPIFLVTHPRAISTAFERVFLTRDRDFVCVHEPFSDAYHWGPEKLSQRYENVEKFRQQHGLEDYTFEQALKTIDEAREPGKRVFLKDMAKCLMPLPGDDTQIVPSLQDTWPQPKPSSSQSSRGNRVPNPTVLPQEQLAKFQYTFLIRNPQQASPSLYDCTVPPKSSITGWHGFKATDAGYREMRILFDYLRHTGQIGPDTGNEICVVDADDLLTYPEATVRKFCEATGIPFDPDSLEWGSDRDQHRAAVVFKNWAPFHDAVLKSTSLQPKRVRKTNPDADTAEWKRKYGVEGARLIQKNIDDNMDHYLYLRQYAIRPTRPN